MTEPTAPAVPEHHQTGDPFVIVVTLDGFLALEGRVRELEGAVPATVDDASLLERVNRHRTELDELKRRYNGLLELLRPYFPAIATTAPESPL